MINAIADVLAQLLRLFNQWTGSYGVGIILLTLAVKAALHPFTRKQLKSMRAMQGLAPQITVLREKHKGDPKTLNVEVMNLYRAHRVNPFSGCLPMLIQIPVLWGLFAALQRRGIFAGATFLGISLEKIPTLGVLLREPVLLIVPVLVGLTTFWQQQMSITDPQQARLFIFMPILVGYFATQFPVGLSIYWIVSTLVYMLEYYLVLGRLTPVSAAPSSVNPKQAVLPQRPKGTKKR